MSPSSFVLTLLLGLSLNCPFLALEVADHSNRPDMSTTTIKKELQFVRESYHGHEGAGFPVERPFPVSGGLSEQQMDPFLMLDHMGPILYGPGEAKGAPWHPHRGFETVTYLVQGEFMHRDSNGGKGTLRPGDMQWMTAGSGIIHHEVPSPKLLDEGGWMEGLQLWVNLPKEHKMMAPRYQDVPKERIATFSGTDFEVKVLAGEYQGSKSTTHTLWPIEFLDFHAKAGAKMTHNIDTNRTAFVFVYRGSARFGGAQKRVKSGQIGLLARDGTLFEMTAEEDDTRFLLLSAVPIGEPVAHRGPFVMNTWDEIEQAYRDYQAGTFAKHKAVFESSTDN